MVFEADKFIIERYFKSELIGFAIDSTDTKRHAAD